MDITCAKGITDIDIERTEPIRPKGARCGRCKHWGRVQNGAAVSALLTRLHALFPTAQREDKTWKLCEKTTLGFAHVDFACGHYVSKI